jgi:hypothetical protein
MSGDSTRKSTWALAYDVAPDGALIMIDGLWRAKVAIQIHWRSHKDQNSGTLGCWSEL